MRAVDNREMASLNFEVTARRNFVRKGGEIFRRADRQARLAQETAPGAEHAEIAGKNIAARDKVDRLHGGACDDRRHGCAADDILAGIGGHGYDNADPEAPRRHDSERPTDPRPTHTRPAHL
jgi:hypothetical protein